MKFGEKLYRLSPKYGAYNVKYNELKHLIKLSTQSAPDAAAVPVGIRAAGAHRWQSLEDDLFPILRDEYNNVVLFLKSKQGEIDRRLAHLEAQVSVAQNSVDNGSSLDRPTLQARRYQRLVKHADAISQEIDQLSQYTSVQKTAFRKILKKYRKWTGSTALQDRLNDQVFASNELAFDYVLYRDRLSALTQTISGLAGPLLSGNQQDTAANRRHSSSLRGSNAKDIAAAADKSPLDLDLALEAVPYGDASGSRYYWIHPDNLDEAESLLLRYMSIFGGKPSGATTPVSTPSSVPTSSPSTQQTNIVVYDNVQRYVQDNSTIRPSNIALSARWTDQPLALVSLSSIKPQSTDVDVIPVKRKDLSAALQRSADAGGTSTPRGEQYSRIRSYLSEHRDVKPLAAARMTRVRYAGNTNSSAVGTWATLDSSVCFGPVEGSQLGLPGFLAEPAEAFPHAILHIRWEFSRMTEVARVFDTSHLAQRVDDFSLHKAAIYTVCRHLEQPKWRQLLDSDIRRVPDALLKSRSSRQPSTISTASLPLSSDGAAESLFSPRGPGLSSVTSLGQSSSFTDTSGPVVAQKPGPGKPGKARRKKRPRVAAPAPRPRADQPSGPNRYWNEFDDGDSDVNPEESYAIYLDPNEETFPGADKFARIFSSVYDSVGRGKSKVISWLSIYARPGDEDEGVRTPLLRDHPVKRLNSSDGDVESSGSDTDDLATPRASRNNRHSGVFAPTFRKGQRLSRRQRALETTIFQFYSGLLVLSYVLLLMAAILHNSGRKKKAIEVNAGVIAGVSVAEICVATSVVLIFMRRESLSVIHWGLVFVNVAVVVVAGIVLLKLALVK